MMKRLRNIFLTIFIVAISLLVMIGCDDTKPSDSESFGSLEIDLSEKEGYSFTDQFEIKAYGSNNKSFAIEITRDELPYKIVNLSAGAWNLELYAIYQSNISLCVDSCSSYIFDNNTSKVLFIDHCPYKDYETISIPDGVFTIPGASFMGCEKLKEITIPKTVSSIGDYAFSQCTSLKSITIPDSVTSIGINAFFNCNSLSEIIIGRGISTIKDYTFSNCGCNAKVFIPDTVTVIEEKAFSGIDRYTYEICIDKEKDSIKGAPWGAKNATVKWKGEF